MFKLWESLRTSTYNTAMPLTMYNGTVIHPIGKCKLTCTRSNSKQDKEEMVQDKLSVNTTSDIFQEYADVFEGIGYLDESYNIEIDPTVKPVIHPPRRVQVILKNL